MKPVNSINIKIPVTDDTFVVKYLNSINGILRLSPQELDVMAAMVMYSTDPSGDVCNTETRKIILRETTMSNSTSLTNVIRAIVKKKALILKTEPKRHYKFHPLVEAGLHSLDKITISYEKPVGADV